MPTQHNSAVQCTALPRPARLLVNCTALVRCAALHCTIDNDPCRKDKLLGAFSLRANRGRVGYKEKKPAAGLNNIVFFFLREAMQFTAVADVLLAGGIAYVSKGSHIHRCLCLLCPWIRRSLRYRTRGAACAASCATL